jgi:hypothetical protein
LMYDVPVDRPSRRLHYPTDYDLSAVTSSRRTAVTRQTEHHRLRGARTASSWTKTGFNESRVRIPSDSQ